MKKVFKGLSLKTKLIKKEIYKKELNYPKKFNNLKELKKIL